MHILFVHQTCPSQFGPVVNWMSRSKDHRVTFLSSDRRVRGGSFEHICYDAPPDPPRGRRIPWTRHFEQHLLHCQGVAQALKRRPDLRPDLVVGHSGLGATLLIPDVRDCPIVNYFEYFYHPNRHDILDRQEFEHPEWHVSWRRAVNAIFLSDLDTCAAGYSPTPWQQRLLPKRYQPKVKVIFDGIDTSVFRPRRRARSIGRIALPPQTRVVTYVARGFELIRGFDVFMKVAKRIYTQFPDVVFVVAGTEDVAYGTDYYLTGQRSLKRWVLKQDDYDLAKFRFVGWLPEQALVQLFNASDLHIYLTTRFPVSWSLLNALACGATVLASDTEPVRDVIAPNVTGLLADFDDVAGLAEEAVAVLRDPDAYRAIGRAAVEDVRVRYSTATVVPQLVAHFARHARRATA